MLYLLYFYYFLILHLDLYITSTQITGLLTWGMPEALCWWTLPCTSHHSPRRSPHIQTPSAGSHWWLNLCNRDLTQKEHCTNCCPEAGLGDYEVGAAYGCFLDLRPFKRKGITYRVMMLQSFSSHPRMRDVSIVMGTAYTESLWTYAGSFQPKEQD